MISSKLFLAVLLAGVALSLPAPGRGEGTAVQVVDSARGPKFWSRLNDWQTCAILRVAPDASGGPGFRVLSTAKEPEEGWVWDAVSALQEVKNFHALKPPFPDALHIRFQPQVVLGLAMEAATVRVALDFASARLEVLPDSDGTCGWLAPARGRLLALVRRAFPSDDSLKATPEELPLSGRHIVTTADGGDTLQVEAAPTLQERYEPQLPPSEREKPAESLVQLRVLVDAAGHPAAIEVTRGASPLKEAVVAAVRRWQWAPGTFRGKPVAAWVDEEFDFGAQEK